MKYPHNNNAYYAECEHCIHLFDSSPEWRKMTEEMAGEFDKEYEVLLESEKTALEEETKRFRKLAAVLPFAGGSGNPSAPESLTDGITPDDTPGVRTPIAGEVSYAMGVQLARKPAIKRKASYAGSNMSDRKSVV